MVGHASLTTSHGSIPRPIGCSGSVTLTRMVCPNSTVNSDPSRCSCGMPSSADHFGHAM